MFLLFDIGGTTTRIAISQTGESLDGVKLFPTNHDFGQAMEEMKKISVEFSKGEKYHAVVGGVRAYNSKKGELLNQPNFPMWVGKPLLSTMKQMWGDSVYLNNDAALVGLGEAVYGAGRGKEIVAYVTLSTGIGGARIINSKVDSAFYGFEPGNMLLPSHGGGVEYFEKLISGKSLQEKYGKAPQDIEDVEIWNGVIETLAIGLNNVTVLWSPEIIVLGGSVPQKLDFYKVNEALKKYVKIYPEVPEVKLAALDEKGGLYGGLAFLQRLP